MARLLREKGGWCFILAHKLRKLISTCSSSYSFCLRRFWVFCFVFVGGGSGIAFSKLLGGWCGIEHPSLNSALKMTTLEKCSGYVWSLTGTRVIWGVKMQIPELCAAGFCQESGCICTQQNQ